MTPGDPYLKAWQARARAVDARWRTERWRGPTQAAHELVKQLGARRVLLFGSLARGSASPTSDVHVWVEGLPEEAPGAGFDAALRIRACDAGAASSW